MKVCTLIGRARATLGATYLSQSVRR
jgi:hypothetical protein